MILGWLRQLGHGLICMWRGGQGVTISKGWKPLMYGCTCGKVFWEAKKQPRRNHETEEERAEEESTEEESAEG